MRILWRMIAIALLGSSALAQGARLWVLRASGEMVEYDPATFAVKKTVKLPPEAVKSPAAMSVNRVGQMLFAPAISLPISDSDAANPHKVWIWNGQVAASVDQIVKQESEEHGSNQAVTESVAVPYLSADGNHLFWIATEARRLEREGVELSATNGLQVWQTDLEGKGREELVSTKLPECRCKTGSCEETCPSFVIWSPETGIQTFFLATELITGQTTPTYKASARYQQDGGKWSPGALPDLLQKVLDASVNGSAIVEAIPDTSCCGWSNESNDQTLVVSEGKTRTVFDEQATYKNSDYDVSFYTANAKLSPDGLRVAMTISSTGQINKPIQLAQQGEANPQESQRIRKALLDLPAIEVKTDDDNPHRLAFVPHAVLIGWISDKELLILENHLLSAYNVNTGTRRKSAVRVEDAGHVFLR